MQCGRVGGRHFFKKPQSTEKSPESAMIQGFLIGFQSITINSDDTNNANDANDANEANDANDDKF